MAWLYKIPIRKVTIRKNIEKQAGGCIVLQGGKIPFWAYGSMLAGGPTAELFYLAMSFGSCSDIATGGGADWEDFLRYYNEAHKENVQGDWVKQQEIEFGALSEAEKEAFDSFNQLNISTEEQMIKLWPGVVTLVRELLQKETLTCQEAETAFVTGLITSAITVRLSDKLAQKLEPLCYKLVFFAYRFQNLVFFDRKSA